MRGAAQDAVAPPPRGDFAPPDISIGPRYFLQNAMAGVGTMTQGHRVVRVSRMAPLDQKIPAKSDSQCVESCFHKVDHSPALAFCYQLKHCEDVSVIKG